MAIKVNIFISMNMFNTFDILDIILSHRVTFPLTAAISSAFLVLPERKLVDKSQYSSLNMVFYYTNIPIRLFVGLIKDSIRKITRDIE